MKKAIKTLLVVFICSSCESSLCDLYKPIFNPEIKGRVTRKFIENEGGRPYSHFVVLNNNDSLFDIKWTYSPSFYEESNIGDSVYKAEHSLILKFYQDNRLFSEMNLNANCSYDIDER